MFWWISTLACLVRVGFDLGRILEGDPHMAC